MHSFFLAKEACLIFQEKTWEGLCVCVCGVGGGSGGPATFFGNSNVD